MIKEGCKYRYKDWTDNSYLFIEEIKGNKVYCRYAENSGDFVEVFLSGFKEGWSLVIDFEEELDNL